MPWLIGIVLTVIVLLGLLFAWLVLDESELPYRLTIRRVRMARTLDGRPALPVIARAWGVNVAQLHVHTCGYCKGRHRLGRDMLYAWVRVPGTKRDACFAYRRSTNELVPASPESVVTFSEMVPPDVEMVCAEREARWSNRILPRHWRELTPVARGDDLP